MFNDKCDVKRKKLLNKQMTQTIDMISNEILCNNDWTKYAKYFINDVGHSSK